MKFDRSDKRRIRAAVDLTPLIDVVFQLVLFFMLSSTFVVQSSIQIEVPEAQGAVALEQKDLSITLMYGEGGPDGKGPIYVDNKEIKTKRELSQILADAHVTRPDLRILIRPDARVETARLVEVLGIAGSVGIKRFGFAARPPETEE